MHFYDFSGLFQPLFCPKMPMRPTIPPVSVYIGDFCHFKSYLLCLDGKVSIFSGVLVTLLLFFIRNCQNSEIGLALKGYKAWIWQPGIFWTYTYLWNFLSGSRSCSSKKGIFSPPYYYFCLACVKNIIFTAL